jgi:cytosine/adenosine deaminase-related metal-dependent hydrolase
VLPISVPPIRDGWVAVDNDRVVACGADRENVVETIVEADRIEHLGSVAILPGLVNAHMHLELSHLRDRVPAGESFVSWIRAVMAARRDDRDPRAPEILAAIDQGIAEAIRCGTAAVGDISNTLVPWGPISASALGGVVFYEIIGFHPADPLGVVERACERIASLPPATRIRAGLAAHAPYSVAPAVLSAIAAAVDRDQLPACSVHLAESVEEVQFIQTGGGPWRELLEAVGAWNPSWVAPGVSPVRYLEDCGLLSSRVVAVHGVQMSAGDLGKLAARRSTLVTCPRSNAYTGAGAPPIEQFYASGVAVAVGTDSLASTPDVNLFSELALMRRMAPRVPTAMLLDSATRQGARALGIDQDYGTIAPGTRARLIAVDVPPTVDDVEEYLVSGIEPDQVHWIV